VLPVVDGAATRLPRLPPPAHQQRRPLRVRPSAPMAPMPLHPHRLTPAQEPRPALVAPPLARLRLPTPRTATPFPDRPLRQRPQPLEKCSPALYDVHGLCDLGGRCVSSMVAEYSSPVTTRFAWH